MSPETNERFEQLERRIARMQEAFDYQNRVKGESLEVTDDGLSERVEKLESDFRGMKAKAAYEEVEKAAVRKLIDEAANQPLRPFEELVEMKGGNCVAYDIARLALSQYADLSLDNFEIYRQTWGIEVLFSECFLSVIGGTGRLKIFFDYDIVYSNDTDSWPKFNNQLKIYQLLHKEGFINLEG